LGFWYFSPGFNSSYLERGRCHKAPYRVGARYGKILVFLINRVETESWIMKSRIVLINPRLGTWSPNVYVPLGLAYVAAALIEAGFDAQILDLNVRKVKQAEFAEKIRNAEIVGITGIITEYHEVVKLALAVRKINNGAKIVLGGALATSLPERMLQATEADAMVIGEGERTMVELVSAIERHEKLGGIR